MVRLTGTQLPRGGLWKMSLGDTLKPSPAALMAMLAMLAMIGSEVLLHWRRCERLCIGCRLRSPPWAPYSRPGLCLLSWSRKIFFQFSIVRWKGSRALAKRPGVAWLCAWGDLLRAMELKHGIGRATARPCKDTTCFAGRACDLLGTAPRIGLGVVKARLR